jgi:hypothetical protein
MYVSEKHKFIYMPPQKTGSTSIAKVLVSEFDAVIFRGWEHDLEKHDDGYLRHLNHVPEAFVDYFIFASVRNPYDRAASLYEETKAHNLSAGLPSLPPFGTYLSRRAAEKNGMCDQLFSTPPIGCVIFDIHAVIKLENLQDDFNSLPFVKKDCTVPHLRKSPNNHRYSPHMAKLILDNKKEDFERFNYSKELPRRLMLKEFV